jgi:murein L,D-transpeptidase YafK
MLKIFLVICFLFLPQEGLKTCQLKYERVKNAYREKEKALDKMLTAAGVKRDSLQIFIRIFKAEKVLELWARNGNEGVFRHLVDYPICASSGKIGPKRRQGDLQVPEGFYGIYMFNPESNFYLSLGVDYPNRSDRLLSPNKKLGGSIFIHGDCVTIGCIPITDDGIKELYICALEAVNSGQKRIQVHIFPARLTTDNFTILKKQYVTNEEIINFWDNLKEGYDFFEGSKTVPVVSVKKNGRYVFR